MAQRIISLIILVLTLTLALTSCASLIHYQKNLGDGYDMDVLSTEDIEELAKQYNVEDYDEYISSITKVTNEETEAYAYFIKCVSSKKADDFASVVKKVVKSLAEPGSIVTVVDGRYILVGSKQVVNSAINK